MINNGMINRGMIGGLDFWACRLKKTGQTTSYVDYDDGYYEMGVSPRYLVYSTGQFSGTTNITINGKTDAHSNNVVLDTLTGLMYSRYVSGSVGPSSDGKVPWTTTGSGATAEGIYPYEAVAKTALLAGYGDWRVANQNELYFLLDHGVNPTAPDATAFPSYPLGIWSSTTYRVVTTQAIVFQYDTDDSRPRAKTESFYCHLVRGG